MALALLPAAALPSITSTTLLSVSPSSPTRVSLWPCLAISTRAESTPVARKTLEDRGVAARARI